MPMIPDILEDRAFRWSRDPSCRCFLLPGQQISMGALATRDYSIRDLATGETLTLKATTASAISGTPEGKSLKTSHAAGQSIVDTRDWSDIADAPQTIVVRVIAYGDIGTGSGTWYLQDGRLAGGGDYLYVTNSEVLSGGGGTLSSLAGIGAWEADGRVHSLVIVYDGAGCDAYMDGVFVVRDLSSVHHPGTQRTHLARYTHAESVLGWTPMFAHFDRAFSAAEVAEIHHDPYDLGVQRKVFLFSGAGGGGGADNALLLDGLVNGGQLMNGRLVR